jgi:small subunit ribosomal protein S20
LATHISAEKRARQTIKRTNRNDTTKSALNTYEKRVRTAVEAKDPKAALAALKTFAAHFDKAASKGIVHAKRASRKISRLSQLVSGQKA